MLPIKHEHNFNTFAANREIAKSNNLAHLLACLISRCLVITNDRNGDGHGEGISEALIPLRLLLRRLRERDVFHDDARLAIEEVARLVSHLEMYGKEA